MTNKIQQTINDIAKLKSDLETLGWNFSKPLGETGVVWSAYTKVRDLQINDCSCNDKPPSLHLTPTLFAAQGNAYSDVEIGIRGELPDGNWIDFKVNVSVEKAVKSIDKAKRQLFAAWNMACEVE